MRIVALQTVRKNSKSVPNKNFFVHQGLLLYRHNIRQAQLSNLFERIYTTTDSLEIAKEAEKVNHNWYVIKRPSELCTDTASHYDTIMHGLEAIEKDVGTVDILTILLGNTPHAYAPDLEAAMKEFQEKIDDYDSCMSVSKFNMFNPFRAFGLKGSKKELMPFATKELPDFLTNRKNKNDKDAFGDVYFFNGSFWIIKRQTLVDCNGDSVFPWLGKRVLPYIQPEGYMEIDASWQVKQL